jgi:hypothetical protein
LQRAKPLVYGPSANDAKLTLFETDGQLNLVASKFGVSDIDGIADTGGPAGTLFDRALKWDHARACIRKRGGKREIALRQRLV